MEDEGGRARPRWALRIGVAAVALVALLGLLALAVFADRQTDRQRPMYDDAMAMAALQTLQLQKSGEIVPVDVTAPDTVTVADREFTPSEGVRVRVEADGDGYCVIGSTDEGDVTPRYCGDATSLP